MMEPIGAEREWTSLSGVHTAEEADFMALLLSNCSAPYHQNGTLPSIWPGHESTMNNMASNYGGSHCSLELSNSNLYSLSQGNISYNSSGNSINEQFCSSDSHEPNLVKKNCYLIMEGDDCLNNQEMSDGSLEEKVSKSTMEDKLTHGNSMKRSRSSENVSMHIS